MPFLADLEARDEPRGAIWRPFAVVRDNVETLVALNLAWFLQLLPGIVALILPQLPPWLRIALGLLSATSLIATAGAMYALALAALRGDRLDPELAMQSLRELALPSLRALMPLFGLFGILVWLALLVGPLASIVTTLATLVGLLWFLCATFWGPLLADHPHASATQLAERAMRLVWRFPAETLATALVTLLALLIGLISIGGLVLIVPVLVTLLQGQRYLDLIAREARWNGAV